MLVTLLGGADLEKDRTQRQNETTAITPLLACLQGVTSLARSQEDMDRIMLSH